MLQYCLISPALYVSIFGVESRILQAEKNSLLVAILWNERKVEGLATMLNKRLMKTRKPITEFTTQLLKLTQSISIEYAKEQGQKCKDKVHECARGMLL